MERIELVKGMKYLGTAYNKKYDEEQCQVYYDFLKKYEYQVFNKAVKNLIATHKFAPSINEILDEIAIISIPALQLNYDDEWEKVIKAVRHYGTYKQAEGMESLNEPVRTVVRQIGWNRMCMSENIEWERKLFYDMLKNRLEDIKDNEVIDDKYLTMTELTKLKPKELVGE